MPPFLNLGAARRSRVLVCSDETRWDRALGAMGKESWSKRHAIYINTVPFGHLRSTSVKWSSEFSQAQRRIKSVDRFSYSLLSSLSLFFLLFLFHFILVLTDDDLETCLPKIGKKPHRSARSISNDGGPHSCVRDSRTWHKLKRRPLDELWPRVVRPRSQISFRYAEMTMMIRPIRIFRDDKSYANPSRKKKKSQRNKTRDDSSFLIHKRYASQSSIWNQYESISWPTSKLSK